MIAKPSRPSVRLTALLLPTMTRYAHGMKKMPSDNDTCLTNGTISVVSTDVAALQYISVATLKPTSDSQKYFLSAGSPFGSLYLILMRSEEHTSEIQSLMRISYAVLFLKK